LNCEEYVSGDGLAEFHTVQYARHKNLIEKVGADAITSE
jgi:hypothetical protein